MAGADIDAADLTMIGYQDLGKIKTAYEKVMQVCSDDMTGHMCWVVDFFPEHLPTESATGNSMWYYLQHCADPMGSISQWPPVDRQTPLKEDILVFSDSYGYCKEILDQAPPGRIGIKNVQAKAASQYTTKDVNNLIAMHPWDMIIFAAGIDPPASNSVEDIHAQQNAVVQLFLTILKKIGDDSSRCKRLAVITVDIFAEEAEIHEECGTGLITNCTLFGMCNTARQEIQCPIQFIDTEWSLRTENTKYLVAELFRHHSFGHNNVRILNSGRYVQRQVSSKPYENKPDMILPDEGIIAISGGNGALGLVMGMWLLGKAMEQGGKKFSIQFLSRSMKISDQNMPNWKDIQKMAAELDIKVEQRKCDCGKKDGVEEYIKSITPNLVGFIHSAGVLQDSMLFNQTWEKFDTVFEAKSRAALYLHDALERFENPNLQFFWMFSSGAVYGNMGQLNYSASNAVLDGLARHRRALGKVAMAPQWGAWGDVGMAANLDDASRRRMAHSPMPYFSNAEGLAGLESLLRSNLAYGQVHKTNPPLMFGMCAGDDVAQQCYTRNFHAKVVVPPPSDPMKNPYQTLSYTLMNSTLSLSNGLVFRTFWPEIAEALEEYEN